MLESKYVLTLSPTLVSENALTQSFGIFAFEQASPHVCGLVAALFSNGRIVNKGKQTGALLRETLNETYCVDIDVEGRDNATGLGFLTAMDAATFKDSLRKVGTSMAVVH